MIKTRLTNKFGETFFRPNSAEPIYYESITNPFCRHKNIEIISAITGSGWMADNCVVRICSKCGKLLEKI